MRKILLVVILGLGVAAASSLSRYSNPVAADSSQTTAVRSGWENETSGRLAALGFHRRPVNTRGTQQWQSQLPRISQRIRRAEKP